MGFLCRNGTMVLHTIGNRDPKGFPGSIPGYGVYNPKLSTNLFLSNFCRSLYS